MKLFRNQEIRPLALTFLGLLLTAALLLTAIGFLGNRLLQQSLREQQAALLGVIVDQYPEAEQDAVRQLRMPDAGAVERGEALLQRYGFYAANHRDIHILSRNLSFSIRAGLVLLLGLSLVSVLCMYRFLTKQYARIQQITDYVKRIQDRDYALDIRDNTEGEISILKNEVYKITVLLKEQAETLKADKLHLSDSISDISHQLKTPITSMVVLNDLLSDNPPPDARRTFLDRMKSQLKRMEWLVSSLLKLSRLDAGTVAMKKDPILVQDLIDKVLAALAIPLEIKLQQAAVTGVPGSRFIGDLQWSSEALINVVKNCIEHTPIGGRIEISFSENPIYTEIRVKDNGIGIDKEDIPHIFNRFYKGKNAGEDSVGIGLAMTQAIIARQGGDINVVSNDGGGTEFIIRFFKYETV